MNVGIAPPFWAALALEVTVKSCICLLLSIALVFLLRRSSAAVRHLIWSLGVASVLLLPVYVSLLPSWHALPAVPKPQKMVTTESVPGPVGSERIDNAAAGTSMLAPSIPEGKRTTRLPLDIWTALLLLWAAGATVGLFRFLGGIASLMYLRRRSSKISDPRVLETFNAVRQSLCIRRNVTLIKSSGRSMPMVWGIFRPVLLLPEGFAGWNEARLRTVFLHELAHIRRSDYLANLTARLACALYWFNPLIWLAVNRMTTEQEHACDDVVISQGVEAVNYADELLQFAATLPSGRLHGAVGMARRSSITKRVEAVLDKRRNRLGIWWQHSLLAWCGLGLLLTPLAMVTAEPEAKSRKGGLTFAEQLFVLPFQSTKPFFDLGTGRRSDAVSNTAVAYVFNDPKFGMGLRIENAHNYPTEGEAGRRYWQTMTPEQAYEPAGLAGLPQERDGFYSFDKSKLPSIVLIPQYGLLEISGVDDRTASVILRYKQVVGEPENRRPIHQEPRRGKRPPLSAARSVVDRWLAHVEAERSKPMWDLTTRENGMDTNIRELWEFKSIKAKYVLGDVQTAMVVTSRFKDNAGREKVLWFVLHNRTNQWLIHDMSEGAPENVQRQVQGFMAHPDVRYHIRAEDIVGDWMTGFLQVSQVTFRPDGSGAIKSGEKTSEFQWELNGDILKRIISDKVDEGRIVRAEDDLFAVRYAPSSQVGYYRVKR